jgi:hypothetical protein
MAAKEWEKGAVTEEAVETAAAMAAGGGRAATKWKTVA